MGEHLFSGVRKKETVKQTDAFHHFFSRICNNFLIYPMYYDTPLSISF